jgi:hypothetical protein
MGGLPGIALVVSRDMKAAADQLSDEGIWPPEPRYGQPHDQQQGIAAGATEIFECDPRRAVDCVSHLPGTGCHLNPPADFANSVRKIG